MDAKKFMAGASAVLVPAAAILALWPQIEPFADWLLKVVTLALNRPFAQTAALAVAAGITLAAFIPHIPGRFMARLQASTTKGWTRFSAGFFTFGFFLMLARPVTISQWADVGISAFVVGGFAAAGWTTFAGWFYKVKERPESLK